MPGGVSCSVSNCTFWGEGNRCAADQILIEIDAHARSRRTEGDEEFAGELGEHRDRSDDSASTCCHTFRPKDS
ncbi:DUF1540 domain-containing protein [Cohnella zeiphila]|uniref:DUF1540 domain-containing protein n=1 Tax=Cohnella zeiphila TaxID=2761120 RepID=A0A7X0SGT0_9BACL|nr:DUF1540 domain-containing protein [Cohnella zeiphila]MBB6729687.1 DUF1540 domain-containing protein [Cohnella zeiphila]